MKLSRAFLPIITAFVVVGSLLITPASDAYQPVRGGHFRSSGIGYVGCQVEGSGKSHSCLVAYERDGQVHLVFSRSGEIAPSLSGPGITQEYTEELTLPAESLTTFKPNSITGVRIVAELPRTGLIDITAKAAGWAYFISVTPLGSCSNGGMFFSLANDNLDGTIGANTVISGTIGGVAVYAWNNCPRYWTSATSGAWEMQTLLDGAPTP